MPDDLIARARELGAPMLAPEPAIARRSALLLKLADRVEALEGTLRDREWIWGVCPWCAAVQSDGHAPGCRLARALNPTEEGADHAT